MTSGTRRFCDRLSDPLVYSHKEPTMPEFFVFFCLAIFIVGFIMNEVKLP